MIEEIDEILFKSISGEVLNADEKKALKNWIDQSKKNEVIYQQFQEYWSRNKTGDYDITDRAWQKLDSFINKSDDKVFKVNHHKKVNPIKRFLYAVAASIALLIGFFIFLEYSYNKTEIIEVSQIIKENKKGEKRTIKLTDGSTIKLNADSRISFPSVFSPDSREVVLEGEAFFEIQEDTNRPFKVWTNDIVTTVKGTSFNVRAFENEKTISVSVLTGNVEVTHQETKQNIDLLPNEMGSYSSLDEKLEKSTASEDCFLWKEGILKFEKAAFGQVVKDFERWYGVDFIVKNNSILKKKDFSGVFKNESLETVMQGISFSGDFEFEIIDKQVIIK